MSISSLDETGLDALESARRSLAAAGKPVLLSGLRGQPLIAATSTGLLVRLGANNVTRGLREAALRVREQLAALDAEAVEAEAVEMSVP